MRQRTIRFSWFLCFLAILTAFLAPCPEYARAGTLEVVTTTTDLASIARYIAGEHATVKSIASGKEDPHFLSAKPSYIVMARDADLWIRVGMDLEIGWEPLIIDGSRNPSIRTGTMGHLDASESVLKLDVPAGRVTRDMGDVHPQGNPHYWIDPLNGRLVAKNISKRLSALRPEHARDFQENLASFQRKLDVLMFGEELVKEVGGANLWRIALREEMGPFLVTPGMKNLLGGWLQKMLPHRDKRIVTYHRSWTYFVNRFGLIVGAELEPKPGIPPSPAHLAAVIETVKTKDIGVILMEPYYSRKPADFVASKSGARVVVCPISVQSNAQVGDYLSLIDVIVSSMSQAL